MILDTLSSWHFFFNLAIWLNRFQAIVDIQQLF